MDDYDDYGDSDNFSPVPVVVSAQIDAPMPVVGVVRNLYATRLIGTVESQTEAQGCPQESTCS